MTLISYRGRAAAMAGTERFYLAPHIAQRPDGDPVKTFVCFLAAYARDVLTGQLPGEPRRYLPARAERYARACLLPPRAFLARAERSDRELAAHFGVPLGQIAARRTDLAADRCVRSRARRPWRQRDGRDGHLPQGPASRRQRPHHERESAPASSPACRAGEAAPGSCESAERGRWRASGVQSTARARARAGARDPRR